MYIHTEHGETVEEELAAPGPWVGIYFEPSITWPSQNVLTEFEGARIVLRAETAEHKAGVLVRKLGRSDSEALSLLNKFLSALSWLEGGGTYDPQTMISTHPITYGKGRGSAVTPIFRLHYLPQNLSEDARLSLAFFREAQSFRYPPYQFLSFYKIINMRYEKGERQKAWIRRNLANVTDHAARPRVTELLQQEGTEEAVATYLYVSCRCAVAHAGHSTTVDPENYEDRRRLANDLPVIRSLAALMIEERFDIFTQRKLWREKPYTLFGLRHYYGEERWNEIASAQVIPRRQLRFPNQVSVRVWGEDFPIFEALNCSVAGVYNGVVHIVVHSRLGCVTFHLYFDLANNSFVFEPLRDIEFMDTGCAEGAREQLAGFKFRFSVLGNGEVEIWDPATGTCLALADAYMPVNFYINPDGYEAEVVQWEQLIRQREENQI